MPGEPQQCREAAAPVGLDTSTLALVHGALVRVTLAFATEGTLVLPLAFLTFAVVALDRLPVLAHGRAHAAYDVGFVR